MTKHSAPLPATRAQTKGTGISRDQTAIDISELPVLPPKNCIAVTLQIERTARPPVIPLDIDDVDLELFEL